MNTINDGMDVTFFKFDGVNMYKVNNGILFNPDMPVTRGFAILYVIASHDILLNPNFDDYIFNNEKLKQMLY